MIRFIVVFFTLCVVILTASPVYAGVLGDIKNVVSTAASTGSIVTGLILAVVLWIFKTIPNEKIYGLVAGACNAAGVFVTLGLTKWKWSAPLWNAHIEPWFIDFLENTIGAAVNGFIAGLRSDAEPEVLPDAPPEPNPDKNPYGI